jgi:hypothetical protein
MDQFMRQIPIGGGVVDVRRAAQRDRRLFAEALSNAWPPGDAGCFADLLSAIDLSPGTAVVAHRRH